METDFEQKVAMVAKRRAEDQAQERRERNFTSLPTMPGGAELLATTGS
jgi:hypothetical protein